MKAYAGGSGGGGIVFAPTASLGLSTTVHGLACNGSTGFYNVTGVTGKAWIDTTGAILLPGIYAIGALVDVATPETNPITAFSVLCNWVAFRPSGMIATVRAARVFNGMQFVDVVSVDRSNIGGLAGIQVPTEADATAVLNITSFAVQLAS